ncbi:MAG: lamin tail domain-containing protein [Deltaproteobacteria bacterium]|nr:lamin tail domain-containing protein [Deltaproteobacteria bacterium]
MNHKSMITTLCLAVTLVASCGLQKQGPVLAENQNFYVLGVSPARETTVTQLSFVEILFSEPALRDSLTSETVFLLNQADYQEYEGRGWDDLSADVRDGDVIPVATAIEVQADGQVVRLLFKDLLECNITYVVVVLPRVQSMRYLSLDQKTAGAEDSMFSSSFVFLGATTDAIPNPDANANVPTEGEIDGETAGDVAPEKTISEPTPKYPNISSEQENGSNSTVADDSGTIVSGEKFDWERILITEIVTDPQQDHGESTPENGIPFDPFAGTGIIGTTDEYIEIFNGTEAAVDLSGWRVEMKDGTDETQALNDSAWSMYFSNDGKLDSFESGEFLVLGNPAGSINNSLLLELYDEQDQLVDSVDVQDANAEDLTDEAFYRGADGEWLSGPASPGGF